METATYLINATNRALGRVASEAAHALLGKRSVRFAKNQALPVKVVIEHAGKLYLPARRAKGKIYTRYSGYPGGLRSMSMEEMLAKKGIAEVMKKTVSGMLPRNRLRASRMKNLFISE